MGSRISVVSTVDTDFNPDRWIDLLIDHLERQIGESGTENVPVFTIYSHAHPWSREGKREAILKRWSESVSTPLFERGWMVVDEGNKELGELVRIVGHLNLKGGAVHASLHRVLLGIGLEKKYFGQGLGQDLMRRSIDWAQLQPSLEWMDLGVFTHNERALAIYKKFGFLEIGRSRDAFRVDGRSIDDIQMTLKLK